MIRQSPVARVRTSPARLQCCSCGKSAAGGECEACRRRRLQRQAARPGARDIAPPSVQRVLASSGQALDAATRTTLGPRLGHDLRDVRIHADAAAAESAAAVGARAWTVGTHIAFAAGAYAPRSLAGRHLLAHELTHAVQQRDAPHTQGAVEIGPADGAAEREADAIADRIVAHADARATPTGARRSLQRMVVVSPGAAAGDILGQFDKLCPGKFAKAQLGGDAQITADCKATDRTSNKSCECLCDVAHDVKRRYTITVKAATAGKTREKLHDGIEKEVPTSSVYPSTLVGENPDITMAASTGSNVEFGAFKPDGSGFWYENWRILAHELCGHGRLKLTGGPSETRGCRPGHDATIDVENAIAAEHSGVTRGKDSDKPRKGESFFNPAGDRSKVLFMLCDGLHFEKP